MKITQDVRDYAATLNDPELRATSPAASAGLSPHLEEGAQAPVSKDEAERGMRQMSEKFRQMGSEVYLDAEKVKESNKAL
jgi:phosphomethylpyrimidine synthase